MYDYVLSHKVKFLLLLSTKDFRVEIEQYIFDNLLVLHLEHSIMIYLLRCGLKGVGGTDLVWYTWLFGTHIYLLPIGRNNRPQM